MDFFMIGRLKHTLKVTLSKMIAQFFEKTVALGTKWYVENNLEICY